METASFDWVKLATDIGSFGLLAWLVYYVFSSMLPGLNREFREELQKEREATASGLRDISRALEKLSVILIYHDASVRGIDPSALGSTEDILRLLRRANGGDK